MYSIVLYNTPVSFIANTNVKFKIYYIYISISNHIYIFVFDPMPDKETCCTCENVALFVRVESSERE